ncbi:unnamed protein product [Prunus armeniaca]|uniref:Uncharacterized protein n=1 Tax=Prunus armeniaca TaxID=36596 RepID=A0A6J5X803_PRUAR|nr:unnamed protein product [Prunus armeniaca]
MALAVRQGLECLGLVCNFRQGSLSFQVLASAGLLNWALAWQEGWAFCVGFDKWSWDPCWFALLYCVLGLQKCLGFEPGAGHLDIPQVPKEGGDLGPGYLPIELPIGKDFEVLVSKGGDLVGAARPLPFGKGVAQRFENPSSCQQEGKAWSRDFELGPSPVSLLRQGFGAGGGLVRWLRQGNSKERAFIWFCSTLAERQGWLGFPRVARVPRGVGRAARVLKEAGLLEFFSKSRVSTFSKFWSLDLEPRHWFLGTRALEKRVSWSWVLSGKAEPLPKGGLRNYIGGAHFLFGKFSLASGAESLEPGVGDLGWSRQGSLQHRGPQSPWCFSSGPLRARFALGPGLFWSRTFRLGDFSKGPESLSSFVKLQGRLSQFFSRAWVRQGLGKV